MLVKVTDASFTDAETGLKFAIEVSLRVESDGFHATYKQVFQNSQSKDITKIIGNNVLDFIPKDASTAVTNTFNSIITAITARVKTKFP